MKPVWMLSMLPMLMAVPAYAGKIDTETGEGCFGAECFGEGFELPDVKPPADDDDEVVVDSAQLCETVATRVYQLCLSSPNAEATDCVAEREDALDRCENPEAHVDADQPAPPSLGPTSSGVYRIPYSDGAEVKVMFDYFTHAPEQGKIDMHAKSRSAPNIVAAATGTIRVIQDSRSKWQHPWDELHKGPCMNNFVWIEHDNGEWSKYSHMQQWSTTKRAGLSVGDWVDEGDLLGYEGKVGCAGSSHLHWEVVDPTGAFKPDDPYAFFSSTSGALLNNRAQNRNRNPRICGIETTTFQDGKSYTAVEGPGAVEPGEEEVVRHGMPINNYLCFLRRGVLADYQPVWIDFFEIDKELFVNMVMRPETRGWGLRTGLDKASFLAENSAMKANGYRLSHIETYQHDGVRYAGIWEERSTPAQVLYVDETATEHQAEVDRLSALGYRPRAVSVVDDGGLKYSALWEQVSGGWELRSTLTLPEYRTLVSEFGADGWEVAAVNAYKTDDGPHISAIWHPADGKFLLATALGKAEFTNEREAARNLGLETMAVTAHEENGRGKFTAVFHQ